MDINEIAQKAFEQGNYTKNIDFLFDEKADLSDFNSIKLVAGTSGQVIWFIQQAYRKKGTQIQVSKEVSDELQATDFGSAASANNVPWPSPIIEFYFEDPKLPTIIVSKINFEIIQELFPGMKVETKDETNPEYLAALMQEGSGLNGLQLTLQLKPEMYEDFLLKGETEDMQTAIFSHKLSDKDSAVMAYMVNLCLKTLAFASIPIYKPIPLTRKQMHYGGKSGVKGRPERPSVRLEYLPKVSYPPTEKSSGETHREFLGRRGHLRWFKHVRFVNRIGTWDYIQPVKNPKTGKYPNRSVIRVRKPN